MTATWLLLVIVSFGATDDPTTAGALCEPVTRLFEDDFEPGAVSERWFFRHDWEVKDGRLLRNELSRGTTRIFLKNAEIGDAIVRFDFCFRGAGELRLVTGGGGHYNAVVVIQRDNFSVHTGINREAKLYPAILGECAMSFVEGEWYTMTVELCGQELLASIDRGGFVVGSHPTIGRERTYFAFQVDGRPAAFDNVHIDAATRRDEWPAARARLVREQQTRAAVKRPSDVLFKNAVTRAHDELHREDAGYRRLVERHLELQADAKRRYPAVYRTNKEAKKAAGKLLRERLASDPAFKTRRDAVSRARQAEKRHLLAKSPKLSELPGHLRAARLETMRLAALKDDAAFPRLVRARESLEAAFRADHADLFIVDEDVVRSRNEARKRANADPEFRASLKIITEARRAIDRYRRAQRPEIAKLEAAMKIERN